MDTLIERKKRFTPRRIYGGAGVLFILVFVFYFIFRDTGSSMTIDKSRITIATVTENEFNDYVRVIGQVLPSRMIYLDAIEGGRVEERLHEEGAMVKKGDVILRLSNPLLNIGIMQSEADLAYQENELRNTRISMEQERLSLKQDRIGIQKEFIIKKRRYGQYKRLMEGQLIAREDYLQATEEYEAVKEQLSVLDERIRQDSLFRLTQISSLDENIMNMKRSLALVRERLENLKVKAPIDGQVGNLEAQIGQSISAGIAMAKGGGSGEMGNAMTISAVSELPTMFLFGYLLKKKSSVFWFRLSGLFFVLKSIGTFLAFNIPTYYAAQPFQMFGWALINVACVYYVNGIMEPQDSIKGQAYMAMTITAGNVMSSLFGGWLIDAAGVGAMLICASLAAFIGWLIVCLGSKEAKTA